MRASKRVVVILVVGVVLAVTVAVVLAWLLCARGTKPTPPPPNPPETPEPSLFETLLVDGTQTLARPEIGSLSARFTVDKDFSSHCTATLVAPSVVLTAAHCVAFRDSTAVKNPVVWFAMYRAFTSYTFTAVEWKVYGDKLGEKDVAIVRLAERVTDSVKVVAPATFAPKTPADTDEVTIYGYGCWTARECVQSGPSIKRYDRTAWGNRGSTKVLAKGDSGGPVVDPNGGLLGLASEADMTGQLVDVFAWFELLPTLRSDVNLMDSKTPALTRRDAGE